MAQEMLQGENIHPRLNGMYREAVNGHQKRPGMVTKSVPLLT